MEILTTICVSCGELVPANCPEHECFRRDKATGVLKLPHQEYRADETAVPKNLQSAIKELMTPAPVQEVKTQKIQPTRTEEEKEDHRAFSLYHNLNEDLVEFLRSSWRNIRLSYIPQKEGKFKSFCKEYSIAIPDDMVSTAPFENGVGPCNGKNEMRSLSGYLTFKMPEDESTLALFDRAEASLRDGLRGKIRTEMKQGELIGVIHDTKLVLTLLATSGDEFRITKYPTEAGRKKKAQ